jgi:hypothetical protein
MNATHAVLMGDLIASERAPSAASLHAAFNEAVQTANRRRRRHIASPLTITLGDEFQGLAPTLAAGLSLLRDLRLDLLRRGVRCRFVLGLARIETPVNTSRAWNMMGPGLSAAREKLADKRSRNAYRFSLPDDGVTQTLLDAVGLSITAVEDDWTDRQFEIVSLSMQNQDLNADLARRLGVTERTLYKIRHAARFDLYTAQQAALDIAIADLDQRHGLA